MSKYPELILPDFYNDIVFSFNITSVKKETVRENSDVVTEVSFLVTGTYEEDTCSFDSNLVLYIDPEQTDFVPFGNLTQEQVRQWLIDDDDLDQYKGCVSQKIQYKRDDRLAVENTVSETSLPWNLQTDRIESEMSDC